MSSKNNDYLSCNVPLSLLSSSSVDRTGQNVIPMYGMTERLKRTIGIRVKDARKRKGLTQKALASRIGVDYTYIGRIERGVQLPSLKMLSGISDVLSQPLSWFLEDEYREVRIKFPPSFSTAAGKERLKGLSDALNRIHPDDIEFFVELIYLLERHRKRLSLSPEVKSERELKVAEGGAGYGDVEGLIGCLRTLSETNHRKDVKEIIDRAIVELKKIKNA